MTREEHEKLWRDMKSRSFDPVQWFDRDDDEATQRHATEATIMWVYRRTEPGLYTVGYYSPQGEWQPEGDYPTREEAAERVHFLNGGKLEKVPA